MPDEDLQPGTLKDQGRWLEYSRKAWTAAGRPPGLDPSLIVAKPVEYDAAYYDYFERRFLDPWMRVYGQVKPDGALIRGEDSAFQNAWRRNFNWETIWKQLLPLFVYGTVCAVNNEMLIQLASHYCVGQAIPSVVIDGILDEPGSSTVAADAAFVALCYAKGLSGLRALGLRAELETCFVDLTRTMYTIMLSEHGQRFLIPSGRLADAINSYLGPKSRLVSSIFFGVLPRWTSLVGNPLPAGIENSIDCLRQVRQLNDEIADVEQDITHGLVTLPWLYGIEDDPKLRLLIERLWSNPKRNGAAEACLRRLHKTDALPTACGMSLRFLSTSMNAVLNTLPFAAGFDVTVLHNVRWAHIQRIVQNSYVDSRTARQPATPPSIFSNALNPVVPVAGAGTLVMDSSGKKVLMGLVSKRGMIRWELPAGVAKLQESMEQAARRETEEETGISVEIDKPVAVCWHHSRELGKGWMGEFFAARAVDDIGSESFRVIRESALGHVRADPGRRPDLYETAKLEGPTFRRFGQQAVSASSRLAPHESILAAGFVEWAHIPRGRMHPLHRKLLEEYIPDQKIELLVRDADTDSEAYEPDVPIYID